MVDRLGGNVDKFSGGSRFFLIRNWCGQVCGNVDKKLVKNRLFLALFLQSVSKKTTHQELRIRKENARF